MSISRVFAFFAALAVSASSVEGASQVTSRPQFVPSDSDLASLHWRFLGPVNYSGKVNDIAVPGPKSGERRPQGTVMYVASATGGLFKTENAGTDWVPIFDRELVTAMDSVTIAPSNANIVWVGTGEPRSWPGLPVPGNGAYKSVDGGKTWVNMGLIETRYVARIAIHPTNPDIVFAATLGSLSKPSSTRGLYRTRDGGASWQRVLFVNTWTGIVDVAIDPVDPNFVYAVAQQRAQSPFGEVPYGPGSGVFKSSDGGTTWQRLSNGLPSFPLGRGTIAVSPARHTTIYALLTVGDPHSAATRGVSVFRSDDAGEHWRRGNAFIPDRLWQSSFFGRFTLDPSNVDSLYIDQPALMVSRDGGETIEKIPARPLPGSRDEGLLGNMPDVHAIWVDPENPAHLAVGYDRGVRTTVDGGKSWFHFTNLPCLQTFQVGIDRTEPFANVSVSTNDNWYISAPVRTRHTDGVTGSDWINMIAAEGAGVLSDSNGAAYVAVGAISRYDRVAQTTTSLGADIPKEFSNVITPPQPLVSSPSRPGTMYMGFDRVMRSDDYGLHWRAVSPPLARTVDSITLMGETVSALFGGDNQGITAISESPLNPNVLLAGTPDGVVHWTRDGGGTWNSSSAPSGLPQEPVSSLVASHGGAGIAYAAFEGANLGDFSPNVYRTTDFGEHWERRGNGLPAGARVSALVEHPRNSALLFAATDRGVFVSFDSGANWKPLRNNMPGVVVWGIALEPNTNVLVVSTWGRGVWVLDDITPLEAWAKIVHPGSDVLFPARPVVAFAEQPPRYESIGTPNPPYGAMLFYYVGDQHAPDNTVEVEIVDSQGTVVHRAEVDATPGLHDVTWNLRPDSWTDDFSRQFNDGIRPAPTGEYSVRLVASSPRGTATKLLAPTVQLSVRPDILRSDSK